MFADDTKIYEALYTPDDPATLNLQRDLYILQDWEKKMLMHFSK